MKFGSNYSDDVPKKAMQAIVDAFKAANSGVTVNVNTVDHNTFQENINNYLQGKPDDVFCWFAGYRMRFFASQGLAGDVSDVWGKLTRLSDVNLQPDYATPGLVGSWILVAYSPAMRRG